MDNCFHVHKNGKILKFREATQRLYYFDTEERHEDSTMLITTVDENKSKFSAYDFSRAKLAWSIQRRIGRPNTRDFIHYVENNLIPNCPVTTQDIKMLSSSGDQISVALKAKQFAANPIVYVHNHTPLLWVSWHNIGTLHYQQM